MKEGWEIRKLGEVATFQRGLTYSKNDEVEYSDNAVLRSNNVDLETNKLDLSEIKYISEKIIIPKDKKIKNGSLLICMANGSKSHLGKVALINIDNDFAFGGFMGLIVPDNNMVSSCYLYYSMITPMYKRFIKGLSDGANINNLKFSDLQKFNIPVPPLSEQQRIVSKLDSAFEKIDALKANAENNLKNAKDLFQQVLKKELESKEGWSEKRMIEIADLCLGKMLDKQKNKGIKQPYLRNVNVRWGSFDCSDILEMPFEKDEETRYSIIKNDIVMCEGGEPGRCAIWTSEKSIKFQKALHRIRCKKGTNPRFLYYTFLMYYNSGKLKKHYSGTTILHLTGEKLKEIFISLPSLSEQQRIVSILDSLSDKCKQLEENYSKTVAECDALKQAVLREVMSVE